MHKHRVTASLLKNKSISSFNDKDEHLIFMYIKRGCTDWAVELLYTLIPITQHQFPEIDHQIFLKSNRFINDDSIINMDEYLDKNTEIKRDLLEQHTADSSNPLYPSQKIVLFVLRHLFKIKLRRKAFHLINSLYIHPQYPNVNFMPKVLYTPTCNFKKREIDTETLQVILLGLSKSRFLQHASRMLLNWPNANIDHYSAVICGFLSTIPPDFIRANLFLNEMKRVGVEPDLKLLECLYEAFCLKNSYSEIDTIKNPEAVAILDMIRSMSI
jgi:hypothetical protein